ncbi:MAG: 8-oxo-dGTP diphosphatase MutT [Candidatus Omnitrophota bacterium]|nr:(deoxy)nucleoside triphosphate pyrophosphohydrolase [Candidatus Omnitrophota bacterium]RKY33536.1 MAG: 8-oxo-dGTP diphosphatase MutT [Candidatus Omnitrophota bacterium]RKY45166.1 MAG: 8-oxo-dGTP diphosphatase MutT [Candidatus Omnitrophota bacterium]HDN85660.1 (deoxy)nucleoside triphosphate pyrophosphohydrolase [Candidatus Omnitrophota bacterium]
MKPCLTVVAGLIRKGKKVLICQRKKDDAFSLLWEFPGGKVEKGESLEEALIRELREELGVEIKVNKLINTFYDENEKMQIKVYLFESKIVKGNPQPLECKEFKIVYIDELDNFDLAPVDKKIALFLKGS